MTDKDKQIYIIGYPKSGNTWLARLLGDYLDSPVVRWNNALPIAAEGDDRKGEYRIYQLHLHPIKSDSADFIEGPHILNLNAYNGEKVVYIVRDPRDVVVSAMHYWGIESLEKAIEAMGNGTHPLQAVGAWSDFVESWYSVVRNKTIPVHAISYESLYSDQSLAFFNLLSAMGLAGNKDVDKAYRVFSQQEIENKRKQIEVDGDSRPYGKETQLHNLRKGIAGDWKNHKFSQREWSLCKWYFYPTAHRIGYRMDWEYYG